MALNTMQQEMVQGQSIAETCRKHNISFGDLCASCLCFTQRPMRTKKRPSQPKWGKGEYISRIIYRKKPRYIISRRINGKQTYFGRYHTLRDAKLIRDYLNEHGWDKSKLPEIQEKLGVK